MTSAGGPPTPGEWGVVLSAPTIPVCELSRAQVPDEPGVYLWRHQGQAVHVGIECSTIDAADQLERSCGASTCRRSTASSLQFRLSPRDGLFATGGTGHRVPRQSSRAIRILTRASTQAYLGFMTLEVLHIEDCPNWQEAGGRRQEAGVRASNALLALGRPDVGVKYRLVSTPDDAELTGFAGSPTLTLAGKDIFPSDGRTADLACRIYFTSHGLVGLPTEEQIAEALRARL